MSLWRKAYLITLKLVDVYSSLIYVHIRSALTFMLTHGVTASAMYSLEMRQMQNEFVSCFRLQEIAP